MPTYSLDGDTSGLPVTTVGSIPYEIDALSPRESWGAGNGSTSVLCRQLWERSSEWIRAMVGRVEIVKPGGTPLLRRAVPQIVEFGDDRPHWCSMVDQVDQGGELEDGAPLQTAVTGWPETRWCRFRATFEVFPYRIRTEAEIDEAQAAAGSYPGARELYRYMVRSRRVYSREQPIPAASKAGGFKVVESPPLATPQPIGQVGFRVVSYADVTYKWVRVPINWPPPIGYTGPVVPWPPLANPKSANPDAVEYARDKYKGRINADWFDAGAPDGYAWAPGTLLYLGYDDSYRYDDAAGEYVCDVVYSFKFKERGWNYFLNAKGEWKEVSLDGTSTGTKPYQTAAFDDLFRHAA